QRAQVLADDRAVLERVARAAASDPRVAESRMAVDHEVRVGRDLVEAGPALDHGLLGEPWEAGAQDGPRRLDRGIGDLAGGVVRPFDRAEPVGAGLRLDPV